MKYQARQVFVGFGRLIVIVTLAFSVRAVAQFEVAPDHFDSNPSVEKKQAAKPAVKTTRVRTATLSAKTGAHAQAQGAGQTAAIAQTGSAGSANGTPDQANSGSAKPATKVQSAKRKKRAGEKVTLAATH
jgi:hypothetical protein